MHFKFFLLFSLIFMVIAAPVVDATICRDCNDEAPAADTSQNDRGASISAKAGSHSPETSSTRDLCPFCANNGAALISMACDGLSAISRMHHRPQQLSFSNISKSITKPPQN